MIAPLVSAPVPYWVVVVPVQVATTSLAAEGLQAAQAALWSTMRRAAQPAALNRTRLRLAEGARPSHEPSLIGIKAAADSSMSLGIQISAPQHLQHLLTQSEVANPPLQHFCAYATEDIN